MIANVIFGADFNFFGDGSIERDFTFIDDAVNSVLLLTEQLQMHNPGFSDIVNLGGGRPLLMNYLLKTVEKLSSKEVVYTRQSGNQNDAKKTKSDSSYIQSLIDSKPSIKLGEGLAKTIECGTQPKVAMHLTNWVNSVKF